MREPARRHLWTLQQLGCADGLAYRATPALLQQRVCVRGFDHGLNEPPPDAQVSLFEYLQRLILPFSQQADLSCPRAEPPARIVLSKEEPELGSGGEQAVGLVCPFGDQVVDQDPNVGLVPLQHERRPPEDPEGRVRASHQTLTCRLLVTGRPVYLAREIEARKGPHLQRMPQLMGREVVVFDRVPNPGHLGPFEAGNRVEELHLNLSGQRSRQAVHVKLRAL